MKYFRHYLHGRQFTVYTDCNSLKASKTKAELTPRVQRWWSYMQVFKFDIEYRPGDRMAHVDFLSRNPVLEDSKNSKGITEKRINVTEITDNWLLAEQQRDELVRDLRVHPDGRTDGHG